MELLTSEIFDLLLLDWHLQIHDKAWDLVKDEMEKFQPNVKRLALFKTLDLPSVVKAMKSGVQDIIWAGDDSLNIGLKIGNFLKPLNSREIHHFFLGFMMNSLAEKAITKKNTLFQARKEFSRVFLRQLLRMKKYKKGHFASLVSVSPKTLSRYLYP